MVQDEKDAKAEFLAAVKAQRPSKRAQWRELRSQVAEKRPEHYRFSRSIYVGNLESEDIVDLQRQPSVEIDYHQSVGVERKRALSELLQEVEDLKSQRDGSYQSLASSAQGLIASLANYQSGRKQEIGDVRQRALDFRKEVYGILMMEGYDPEDLKRNLVSIDEAFQAVHISQIDDPELRKLMQQVRSVRRQISALEKEKSGLEHQKYTALQEPDVAQDLAQLDEMITAIDEPYYLEYVKNVQKLEKRENYIISKDLNLVDEDILDPQSEWVDELLFAKYTYLQLEAAELKAKAVFDLWAYGEALEEGKYLLDNIYADFGVESLEELEELEDMLLQSYPVDFHMLGETLGALRNVEIRSLEDATDLFRKVEGVLRGVERNPVRLISNNDELVFKNHYNLQFEALMQNYMAQVSEAAQEVIDERNKIIEEKVGSIDRRIRSIDAQIKAELEDSFGADSRLEAAEQLLLSGGQFQRDEEALSKLRTIEKTIEKE